jgi:SAM-dependent methyltransferase
MESPARGAAAPAVRHLPYAVDESRNRAHFYENYWKRVGLALLQKHASLQGWPVLDYGCGRGEALEYFRDAGCEVTGTDLDPECVRLAAARGRAVLLRPQEAVAQFGAKSFDVVTCFHVLEHVPCPVETLNVLRQIARRYVLLAVPNLRQLRGLTQRQIDLRFVNEGHLQSWDHWHFRNLAERHCGLELVEWGFDATQLPGISEVVARLFGERAAIWLETGLFRRLFPFHGISVIGLFRVPDAASAR